MYSFLPFEIEKKKRNPKLNRFLTSDRNSRVEDTSYFLLHDLLPNIVSPLIEVSTIYSSYSLDPSSPDILPCLNLYWKHEFIAVYLVNRVKYNFVCNLFPGLFSLSLMLLYAGLNNLLVFVSASFQTYFPYIKQVLFLEILESKKPKLYFCAIPKCCFFFLMILVEWLLLRLPYTSDWRKVKCASVKAIKPFPETKICPLEIKKHKHTNCPSIYFEQNQLMIHPLKTVFSSQLFCSSYYMLKPSL